MIHKNLHRRKEQFALAHLKVTGYTPKGEV